MTIRHTTLLVFALLANTDALAQPQVEPADCIAPLVNQGNSVRHLLEGTFNANRIDDYSIGATRARLIGMMEADQAIINVVMQAARECGTDFNSPTMAPLIAVARDVRKQNWQAIATQLDAVGWPVISKFGAEADRAAFLVVQHADRNPSLQQRALELLEPLVRSHETDPENYALLYDRVQIGAGRSQRYGSQGQCNVTSWDPDPTENPDTLDERRAQFGLKPMAEYRVWVWQEFCPHS